MSVNTAMRFFNEAAPLICIGGYAALFFAPKQSVYDEVLESSPAIIEQSLSLAVEYTGILRGIEKVHYSRLVSALKPLSAPHNTKTRKIAQADLDELSRNLSNIDTFADVLKDREKTLPFHSGLSVKEEFRLIPKADLDIVLSNAMKRGVVHHVPRTDESKMVVLDTKDSVIRVFDILLDTSHLVTSFGSKFERQQERLDRLLIKKGGEMLSPEDAVNQTGKTMLFTLLGYGSFCLAMNKFWTPIMVVPRMLPAVKGLLIPTIIMSAHLLYNHYTLSILSTKRMPIAEDKSIYSSYFNPFNGQNTTDTLPSLIDGLIDVFGITDEELLEVEESSAAEIPFVWHGATLRDPFTQERLYIHLFLKPLYEEYIYRVLLFTRLMACGGVVPAMVVTPLIYAYNTTNTPYDLRAPICHLTPENAFVMNAIDGLTLCALYWLTGNYMVAVLVNISISTTFLRAEFITRGDFIRETLSMWPTIQSLLRFPAFNMNMTQKCLAMFRKQRLLSDVSGVTEKYGEPTNDVKLLARTAIEHFGSMSRNGGGESVRSQEGEGEGEGMRESKNGTADVAQHTHTENISTLERIKKAGIDSMAYVTSSKEEEVKVMTPEDAYVFTESLHHAAHVLAKEQVSKEMYAFLYVDYADDKVRTHHQRHYSHALFLPLPKSGLRRSDFMRAYIRQEYPNGLTEKQFEKYVATQLIELRQRYKGGTDIDLIKKQVTKWERMADPSYTPYTYLSEQDNVPEADGEFLDLIDSLYSFFLNKLQVDAVLFGVWRSSTFLDDLAGRRSTPEDSREFKADLKEWMTHAYARSFEDSLLAFGLTHVRFNNLLQLYQEKDNLRKKAQRGGQGEGEGGGSEVAKPCAAVELKNTWEEYFKSDLFQKKIYDIVDPFGGRKGR